MRQGFQFLALALLLRTPTAGRAGGWPVEGREGMQRERSSVL